MKPISPILLSFLVAVSLSAGSVSYVILQESEQDSLIRVSADGKTVTTIANGAAGVGLAVDRWGDYVVAAGSALLRVSRSGTVTTIANAPAGAEWVAVAADRGGNLIVADNSKHVLWRVSEDGQSVVSFVEYPEAAPQGASGIGLMADESGYLMLRIGDDDSPNFYRVNSEGAISRVSLSGEVNPPKLIGSPFRSIRGAVKAVAGGPIIPDGSGNYLFLDDEATRNVSA